MPKFSKELKWKNPDWLICDNLYKGIFNIDEPKVMYLGMQHQILSYVIFDVQAKVAVDFIIDELELPSYKEMQEDIYKWMDIKSPIKDFVHQYDEAVKIQQ